MKRLLHLTKVFAYAAMLTGPALLCAQTSPQNFTYTGGAQSFTVPCGVTSVTIYATGARGGDGATGGNASMGGAGGMGSRVEGTFPVSPGDVLNIYVGGQGNEFVGGYNGGGAPGNSSSGGGGGATDIRLNGTALSDRIFVAAGGGGGGRGGCEASTVYGGDGGSGNANGFPGTDAPTSGGVAGGGAGGNAFGGGAGIGCGGFLGANGGDGAAGVGGDGGAGQSCCCFSAGSTPAGGGGGGGYMGGGGGGGGSAGTTGCSGNDKGGGGGGAGGTTYISGLATNTLTTAAYSHGDGSLIITWSDPLASVPTLTATPDAYCAGTTQTYSVSAYTNATSYTWSTTGGLSITAGSGTASVSVVATGTGTISVIANTPCGPSPSASYTVLTVYSLPSVTANVDHPSICFGQTITLTGGGASSYTWSNGASDGVAFPPPAGSFTYSVTGTDAHTCSATASVGVTVNHLPSVTAHIDHSTVCAGQTVTLTGGGASSYTWSNGASDGVAFSPAGSLTYSVTGTDAHTCSATASVGVTVNQLPSVTAHIDHATICAGQTVTLTGGGASSYTWSNGASDGVAFSPAGSLTYSVTGTDGNTCSATASVGVTVNQLPSVTAHVDHATVCAGQTVTLTGGGASSYTWSNGASDGVAFSPAGSLTYSVTGTDANTCSATASVGVTVNQLPSVTAHIDHATVCAGQTVTLTGGGASSYTWSNGASDGVAFSPAGSLTYSVTGTDAHTCSATASVGVTVNQLPSVTATATPSDTLCAGDNITLSGGGASTYAWSGSVVNGTAFAPASSLTYTVTGTDANTCSATASVAVVVNQCLGIVDPVQNPYGVMVYPNPSSGAVIVSANKVMSKITIYSAEGKLVIETSADSRSKQIDLSHLAAGSYIVKVTGKDAVVSYSKVIKE